MRILQLTKKFPFPLKDGESIAVTNLSQALVHCGCDVTLLSMNTSKHYVEIDKLPADYNHYSAIHTVYLDNRVTVIGAAGNLFSSDSYHVSRFDFDAFRDRLIALLQATDYDVIQLETLYLAPYIETIKKYSRAKVVMRAHNVEYEIWNRVVASTSFILKRYYLKYLTNKLARFEVGSLPKYDALVTVTQRDLDQYRSLGYSKAGLASPIGIESEHYKSETLDLESHDISFIGSLDWMPNTDGLRWFIREVFPLVLQQDENTRLHIAGRNTPDDIYDLASDSIVIHGEVDDAHSFLNAYPITIVPLLSGSGMRVKILEGMALGRVVVSTTIGAEGIGAMHGSDIIIADSAASITNEIIDVWKSPDRMKSISSNAQQFIAKHFDRIKNAKKLIQFYEDLLED